MNLSPRRWFSKWCINIRSYFDEKQIAVCLSMVKFFNKTFEYVDLALIYRLKYAGSMKDILQILKYMICFSNMLKFMHILGSPMECWCISKKAKDKTESSNEIFEKWIRRSQIKDISGVRFLKQKRSKGLKIKVVQMWRSFWKSE